MTDLHNVESLVLEHLRHIRADVGDVKREVANNSLQIGLLGQQIGALTTAVYTGKSDEATTQHLILQGQTQSLAGNARRVRII